MDLKNKLSEEEAKDIFDFAYPNLCAKDVNEGIERLKQAGIIRKRARKELDEYIAKIIRITIPSEFQDLNDLVDIKELKQLIDAALKEAAESAERKEG